MSTYMAPTCDRFPVGTDLSNYKSLRDILCSSVPPPPKVDPPDALGGTKKTTPTEVAVFPLNTVVYCPEMFTTLLKKGEELAKNVAFDYKNQQHVFFAAYAIPSIATSLYPKKFHSEEAVAWWSTFSILWPAMAALRCVYHKKESVCFEETEKFPFLSSGTALRIIPDAVVVNGEALKGSEGRPEIAADIEFKSPNAFANAKLESLMPDLKAHQFTWPQDPPGPNVTTRLSGGNSTLTSRSKTSNPGAKGNAKAPYAFNAMRFLWPEVAENIKEDSHHQTRVILQVWAQMVDRQANVGLLSCADRTVLFIRDRETSVVYMSQQYGPESRPILAVFSLFAAGLDLIKMKDLKVVQMTGIIDPEAVKEAKRLKKIREAQAKESLAREAENSEDEQAKKQPEKTDQEHIGIYPRPHDA